MADETTRVDQWIQSTLTGDVTLMGLITGAYADVAPQGSTYPVVVHQHQGSVDVRTATGDARIMISGLWLVRGIAKTETYHGVLASIADRLDELIEEQSGAAGSDGVVFSSTREAPFRLAEDDEGASYRHLGGLFRIYAQVP